MTAMAALLATWAGVLARLPAADTATVVAALGADGRLTPRFGNLVVEPPPAGLTEMVVAERDGDVFYVEIVLPAAAVTRAELDAALGEGRWIPRVHWQDPVPLAHRVEVLGAPHTCMVFAYYATTPEPTDSPASVMLRRDRAAWTYPRFCTVDDHPVRLDRQPDGTVGACTLDLRSGALVRVDDIGGRLTGFRDGIDELDHAGFDRLVTALRRAASHVRQVTPMAWHATGDPELPYRARLDGTEFGLVEGDVPVEPRYTLVVDGQDVDHLDAWPAAWTRG